MSGVDSSDADVAVVGLGPSGLDRLAGRGARLVLDSERTVIVRTIEHPAAAELGAVRPIVPCDDIYEGAESFEAAYRSIVDRVLGAAENGPVVYAVPGSAAVGESTVRLLLAECAIRGWAVSVVPGESFLDLACLRTGVDPIADGLQVVDGRDLPDPLPLHLPTFITQVDAPHVIRDVAVSLGAVLDEETPVTVLERLGDQHERVTTVPLREIGDDVAATRTTLYLPPTPAGWLGLVATNRRLRSECPWDAEQTHHSLVSHLIEEAYETVDAIGGLPFDAPGGAPDLGAYAVLEDELGDLLLQVVFHATLAAEAGAFDVEEVAESVRRKLVRRHPHVFGDVTVSGPDEVLSNWEAIKGEEKARASLMDDVPVALPAVAASDKIQRRAASVGFDWSDPAPVFDKVEEELAELRRAEGPEAVLAEFGDVLFSVVNLARHLKVDPELALARANRRFSSRFRAVEAAAAEQGTKPADLTLDQLDALWNEAKRVEG